MQSHKSEPPDKKSDCPELTPPVFLSHLVAAPAHVQEDDVPSFLTLSPRPHMFRRMTSVLAIVGASFMTCAMACAGSSAGMMPSQRLSVWMAASASLSVTATYCARPDALRCECSGPTPGSADYSRDEGCDADHAARPPLIMRPTVEASADGVRLHDLPVDILGQRPRSDDE